MAPRLPHLTERDILPNSVLDLEWTVVPTHPKYLSAHSKSPLALQSCHPFESSPFRSILVRESDPTSAVPHRFPRWSPIFRTRESLTIAKCRTEGPLAWGRDNSQLAGL